MNAIIVELIGTLFFVYVILVTGNPLAIGAALAIAIFLGGPISGGSFNPAVTLMLSAAGKIKANKVLPYILAEITGGLAAFELYKRIKS
jgi:glycerol uptake facilitator-like aquaporin